MEKSNTGDAQRCEHNAEQRQRGQNLTGEYGSAGGNQYRGKPPGERVNLTQVPESISIVKQGVVKVVKKCG